MTVEEIADHEVALRDRLELPLESVRNVANLPSNPEKGFSL
jgi:hypothetical protein